MNVNRVTALALIIAVGLAGCSSLGPSDTQPTTEATQSTTEATQPTTTTTTQTSTPTATPTPSPTPTSTPSVATPAPPATSTATSTPTETWTKPQTPKDPEDKSENRISSVKFVNKEEASSGGGYTDFDLQASANTFFSNVDPTPSEDGEPYFYVEINGQGVAREEVSLRSDGTFTIDIHPEALEQFDSGTLEVTVTLYDVDHKHDDEYGSWTGTIEYTATDDSNSS